MSRNADSPYNDCRQIDEIGFVVANNLETKTADTAACMVIQGQSAYHVVVDGERFDLHPAGESPNRYLRTLDEDSPDDPLLRIPSIQEYEREQMVRFNGK